MLRWVYAGGKKLPGLEKRRQQETEVCLGNVTSVSAK
jgi:GH24 family phage-related lysozyme (muramidase)